jgi:AmmeMemoRadiSam system protein A
MHKYVKLAFKVIQSQFDGNEIQERKNFKDDEDFKIQRGCFVTLHNKDDSLRGCIGTIEPFYENLYEEIYHNAISAAFKDPRFPKLKKEELENIKINVDVLGELEKVYNLDELNPKKYGVVLESGLNRGVLLPNIEGVDTVEKQLTITKMKAGIRSDDYEIYKFQVNRYE